MGCCFFRITALRQDPGRQAGRPRSMPTLDAGAPPATARAVAPESSPPLAPLTHLCQQRLVLALVPLAVLSQPLDNLALLLLGQQAGRPRPPVELEEAVVGGPAGGEEEGGEGPRREQRQWAGRPAEESSGRQKKARRSSGSSRGAHASKRATKGRGKKRRAHLYSGCPANDQTWKPFSMAAAAGETRGGVEKRVADRGGDQGGSATRGGRRGAPRGSRRGSPHPGKLLSACTHPR